MATAANPFSIAIEDEDLEKVLREEGNWIAATEALQQLRISMGSQVPSPDGLDSAAAILGKQRAQFWVEQIKATGHLQAFVAALSARGVSVHAWPIDPQKHHFDEDKFGVFLGRAATFRCRIKVNGDVKGSGVLVGPSSVLTAWHVIATASPGTAPWPPAEIEVMLSDGRTISAVVLADASSPCGDMEWPPAGGRAPINDAEVQDRHDVALLRLKKPAGIHLTFAALASPAYTYRGPLPLVLISHPAGEWHGIATGRLRKVRNVTARWAYDVQGTLGGSSGGGCFDTAFDLAGIHQGRVNGGGRLVPLVRFDSLVREAIADDETPASMWSLDGTPESTPVVGRDGFFIGYHSAMRGPPQVRGVWCRRVDLQNDVSGLPFTYEMLTHIGARSQNVRIVRISFDSVVHDLPEEIARRASAAGIDVSAPIAIGGVGEGHTEPEAVVADRSRRLAQVLDVKAREMGAILWLFFDHPAMTFGDESRWALTAFLAQALRCESLRVVLAGYEAIQMPGAQFESAYDAMQSGAPGLMVEYLADVNRLDVQNLIETAAKDFGRAISPERVKEWIAEALVGLYPVNGRYDSAHRTTIALRLQPRLQQLRDEGSGG